MNLVFIHLVNSCLKNRFKVDDIAKLDDIIAQSIKLISETNQNYLVNQSNNLNDPLAGPKKTVLY